MSALTHFFGKSRPNNVANLRCYDSWGTRKGGKFVRSYYKKLRRWVYVAWNFS